MSDLLKQRLNKRLKYTGAVNVLDGIDYAALEARVVAALSEKLSDPHVAAACVIFKCTPEEVTPERRRAAKAVSWGLLCGMQPKDLHNTFGAQMARAAETISGRITEPNLHINLGPKALPTRKISVQ